jgi:hypothetical protein
MLNKSKNIILILIGLLNVIIHLFLNHHFEYHRDELLYFSMGQHLDFGYATVPPLIGFLAFISKSVLGYSLYSVRFFPAVFSGILVYLTSRIAKELKGGNWSQIISAIGVVGTSILVMIFGIFTPIFLDVFFWTLTFYLVIKYVNTELDKYLLFLGISIGFAILNKYSIVFLIASLLIVLPFTNYRNVFTKKAFYYCMLLAFLIALPNLVWQIWHHFPVINHMKELHDSQLINVDRLSFLFEQLILPLPLTLIIIPGILYFVINKQFNPYRFLVIVSAFVILLFLIFRGKSYYTAGIFPFLIVCGALFIEKYFTKAFPLAIILALLIVLSYLLLPTGIPMYKPDKMVSYFDRIEKITGTNALRRDEDGIYRSLPQLYADMLGWEELTEITNEAWQKVDKKKCIIYCENYGQAGAINMIGKKYNLPEPISFCDAFGYWFPKEFEYEITEFIYINDELGSDVNDLFEDIEEIGRIKNEMAIEYNVQVYLCKKPRSSFNKFWSERTKNL